VKRVKGKGNQTTEMALTLIQERERGNHEHRLHPLMNSGHKGERELLGGGRQGEMESAKNL